MKLGRELRVGIFVMGAIAVGGFIAFAVGSQSHAFEPKTTYRVIFDNVSGLRPGSPVQLAGVPIGSIESVNFNSHGHIEVRFEVLSSMQRLIRGVPGGPNPETLPQGQPRGTVASIQSKGMLGDQLLGLTVGDGSLPEWPPERPLPTSSGGGIMQAAQAAMDEVKRTAQNLRRATDSLANEQFTSDIQATAHNLSTATRMLAEGDGAIQHLMTDEETARELDATLTNVRQASAEIAALGRSLRHISEEIERGDGGMHDIIYGDSAESALRSIGRAGDELALALAAIREGDGTAHDLVYGNAGDEIVENLTQASEDLAAITANVRAGRGTIGGLLVDPSIYEDVKRLVGDLERNDILRALVRYSIRRDESGEPAHVTEQAPASAEGNE
jgi:phospholipid/cholesterol/gamma-HCH transport system substrate-binding protein